MPKTITLLRIFVASPSDVNVERSLVRNVVDELNLSVLSNSNFKFEVVGWETHTYPNIGEDAQDVINSQINDDYDIFIGLMWSRFGSPTKRSESGSKEEFERAYKKYLENSNEVSLLFYFKNAPIPFSEIEPYQIQKIKDFQEQLKEKGVLYKHFTQEDEFEKLLRLNLSQLINNYIKANSSEAEKKDMPLIKIDDEKSMEEDEELGMYDYIDQAILSMKEMETTLSKLTKYIAELGSKMTKKAEKINLIKSKPNSIQIKETRKIIDTVADDMTLFNQRSQIEIPVLNEQFSISMKNYSKAISIYKSYAQTGEETEKIFNSLTSLKDAIKNSLEGIGSMKDAVISAPAFTKKYAKAKKETSKVLTDIINEFVSYLNLTEELIKNLTE